MMKRFFIINLFVLLLAANSLAQNKDAGKKLVETIPVPVSYGIIVDNSGSYRLILDNVIETAKNIVEENKADDETFLARFVDAEKFSILQDFTDSKEQIQSAANDMFAEGGLTAILDAVNSSAKYLAEKSHTTLNRNKVLVLISDGDDRKSSVKIEDVVKFLKAEKIRVFTIALSDEKVSTKLLDKLAKETGGKVYAPKNRADITNTVKELATAIRAQ